MYSATSLSSFVWYSSFLWILKYFLDTKSCHVKLEIIYYLLYNLNTFYSFHCLIALVRTSSTMLYRSGKSEQPCIFPFQRGKVTCLSPWNMILNVQYWQSSTYFTINYYFLYGLYGSFSLSSLPLLLFLYVVYFWCFNVEHNTVVLWRILISISLIFCNFLVISLVIILNTIHFKQTRLNYINLIKIICKHPSPIHLHPSLFSCQR